MKKIILLTLAIVITTCGAFAQTKAGKVDVTKHTAYYTCPQHPEVSGHKPGKCPKCGMQLNLSSKEQMKAETSKNYTCPIHADVTSSTAGTCPKCDKQLNLSNKEKMKAEAVKDYVCPMHADMTSNKAGKCTKCGMAMTKNR